MKFIGGALCLDFVNTVGGRAPAPPKSREHVDTVLDDKITSYEDLLDWSRLAGDVPASRLQILAREAKSDPQGAAAALDRMKTLRESLYRIFKSAVEKHRPAAADMETLGRELAAARHHERLTPDGSGFAWTFDDPPGALDRVLWPVARSAAALLTSPELSRLRQCGGERCGWLFLDTSRNHSRRWCDMSDCGNRAKVRSFRLRRA